MKHISRKHIAMMIIGAVLGFFWAYSFSTRIGLFFIIPLWLKILVLGFLWLSLSFLAYFLADRLLYRYGGGPAWVWLLAGAVILAGLVFLLVPYQWKAFETTHTLTVEVEDHSVIIEKVLSPDKNIIPRENFITGSNVPPYEEHGFYLREDTPLSYKRAQIGGLTLIFIPTPGKAAITWDGETHTINLDNAPSSSVTSGWKQAWDSDNDRLEIQLPGNTWGKPDPFWTALAVLMPVADFFSLASLIAGLTWLGLILRREKSLAHLDWRWAKAQGILLGTGLLSVVMFEIGLPDFMPWWFLAMFLPAALAATWMAVNLMNTSGILPVGGIKNIHINGKKALEALRRINRSRWTLWIALILLSLIGALIQLQLTKPGLGVSGDPMHYLQGAENLASGLGYVRQFKAAAPVPITGFPPFYSMVLSLGVHLGLDSLSAARFFNTGFFVITLILTGWLVFVPTRSTLTAVLSTTFVLFSPAMLGIFVWVMSETLFLPLTLASIALWVGYIRKPALWKIVLVGLAGGLATLTRLVGVALLATLCLATLIHHHGKALRRWIDAFVLGITGIIPLTLFFIRNSLVSGTISEARDFHLAPFKREFVQIVANDMADWFGWNVYFQETSGARIAILVTLLAFLALFIFWRFFMNKNKVEKQPIQTMDVLFLFSLIYCLTVITNVIVLAPEQTQSGLTRYLLPVYLCFGVWAASLLDLGIWRHRKQIPQLLVFFFVLSLFSINLPEANRFVADPPTMFREYTDRKIACESEWQVFDNLPEDQDIYTNNCEFFFYLSGTRCLHLSMTAEDYQPGGVIYEDVREGDVIAYVTVSGFSPPGIQPMLKSLDAYQSGCYFTFYRWPE